MSRDWIGVPRKLFKPGVKPHCVCVRTTGPPSDQSPENPIVKDRKVWCDAVHGVI